MNFDVTSGFQLEMQTKNQHHALFMAHFFSYFARPVGNERQTLSHSTAV